MSYSIDIKMFLDGDITDEEEINKALHTSPTSFIFVKSPKPYQAAYVCITSPSLVDYVPDDFWTIESFCHSVFSRSSEAMTYACSRNSIKNNLAVDTEKYAIDFVWQCAKEKKPVRNLYFGLFKSCCFEENSPEIIKLKNKIKLLYGIDI